MQKMRPDTKKRIVSLALPVAVGGLSALLTTKGMRDFQTIQKPPLTPPAWLFPVAWTALYLLMGYAFYLVWTAPKREKNALFAYGIQLALNFFWSLIFFGAKSYLFAFFWLLALLGAILWTAALFYKTRPLAGALLVPYLLWVTFAGYLNFGVYLLNR